MMAASPTSSAQAHRYRQQARSHRFYSPASVSSPSVIVAPPGRVVLFFAVWYDDILDFSQEK
jgi:hypothetical protein